MNLSETMTFVREAHEGQNDKAGEPYWKHLFRVMRRMVTLEEQQVALLHDILEDTYLKAEDLLQRGFAPSVVASVVRLTRPQGVDYYAYIAALASSGDRTAIRVKLADLGDNLDPARPINPSLAARYIRAVMVLERVR